MPNAELSIPVRLIVIVAVGIVSFALFFGATLVVLGQTGHLTYASGMTGFIACCTVAIAVSVVGGVGPFRSYITGGNRHRFLTVATWTSIFLPFASMVEFAMFSFEGYWWFAVPAQTVAAGLLGIVVAISRRGWWWLLGLWGAVLTATGVLQATVPLWAK